jgi:hypothetical protein
MHLQQYKPTLFRTPQYFETKPAACTFCSVSLAWNMFPYVKMSSRHIIPLNTDESYYDPNMSGSTKPTVPNGQNLTLQELLHLTACDIGIAFYLHYNVNKHLEKFLPHIFSHTFIWMLTSHIPIQSRALSRERTGFGLNSWGYIIRGGAERLS